MVATDGRAQAVGQSYILVKSRSKPFGVRENRDVDGVSEQSSVQEFQIFVDNQKI